MPTAPPSHTQGSKVTYLHPTLPTGTLQTLRSLPGSLLRSTFHPTPLRHLCSSAASTTSVAASAAVLPPLLRFFGGYLCFPPPSFGSSAPPPAFGKSPAPISATGTRLGPAGASRWVLPAAAASPSLLTAAQPPVSPGSHLSGARPSSQPLPTFALGLGALDWLRLLYCLCLRDTVSWAVKAMRHQPASPVDDPCHSWAWPWH